MSPLVEESLSVSGILLGKTMGRGAELAERFSGESSELADLEVRSRMAGRWRMAVGADELRDHARARLLVRRPDARRRRRSRSARSSPSRRCRRGCCSRSSRCCRSASTCRRSLALFDAHLRVPRPAGRHRASAPTRGPGRRAAATSRFEGVSFRYDPDGAVTLRGRRRRGARRHDDGDRRRDRHGQDDARLPRRAPLRRRARRGHDRRGRRARPDLRLAGRRRSGVVSQETYLFHASIRENLRFASPTRPTRRSRTPRAPRRSTT